MKISRLTWLTFLILSCLSFAVWFRFSYPQIAFVNLSVDRSSALTIAKDFLKKRGVDHSSFHSAIIFGLDSSTTRFLQKTIGPKKELDFLKQNNFDLFFWIVRFYKEAEKEEYRLTVSSASGEVTAFKHIIDEDEARPSLSKDEARALALEFLKTNFHFTPEQYSVQGELQSNLDHRIDYAFSWQKDNSTIPWTDGKNSGNGKLLTGLTVSGGEVLAFSKNTFLVPEQFARFIEKEKEISYNIAPVMRAFYFTLFIAAIFFMIVRRNHLAMHLTKKFYIGIAAVSFILSLLYPINNFQIYLFDYPTTSSLTAFLWRLVSDTLISALFVNIAIAIPGLAGELLHYETWKEKKEGAFLHYILSTFCSSAVGQAIVLGYFVCVIMLGIQSLLIHWGRQYLGVWVEHNWMAHFSNAYWPFLTALTIGYKASFSEETLYRLFGISLGKKIFKNTIAAVIAASMIWGFAHSSYPVYPMWFRGLEVTCLGLFLGFIYLRFGLVTVIVAHYLFDVFWSVAEHVLGQSNPFYFYSSIVVLLLPLVLAAAVMILNRPEKEKPLRWQLTKDQLYNLEILRSYLQLNKDKWAGANRETLAKEIASHGWDIAVVEVALEDL